MQAVKLKVKPDKVDFLGLSGPRGRGSGARGRSKPVDTRNSLDQSQVSTMFQGPQLSFHLINGLINLLQAMICLIFKVIYTI